MLKINFITNFALTQRSGGWSGISFAIFTNLAKKAIVNYIGPINPPPIFIHNIISKIKKIFRIPRKFVFFSERRLSNISNSVSEQSLKFSSDIDIYFGSTPWIKCSNGKPYAIFMDCTFSTYISVYHDKKRFIAQDLERINSQEIAFFNKASHLFFMTNWPAQQFLNENPLFKDKVYVVGSSGFIRIPDSDNYKKGNYFLFVSLNFNKKGGSTVVKAFQKLHNKYPNLELYIIGERPPDDVLSLPGIRYKGIYNKNNPDEFEQLCEIFSNAFALVHPTKMDINPLIITEVQYYGCPVIASNRFGIPDLVKHNYNGFLVDNPDNIDELFEAMSYLCIDNEHYLRLRKNARYYSTKYLTWPSIIEKMLKILSKK